MNDLLYGPNIIDNIPYIEELYNRPIVGVYGIFVKRNLKWYVYIGQSIDCISAWKNHIELLRSGVHYNYKLQLLWNIAYEKHFYFQMLNILKPHATKKRRNGIKDKYIKQDPAVLNIKYSNGDYMARR